MLTKEEMAVRLQTIDSLPTLPTIMLNLSTAMNDINCSAAEIEKILVTDPAIATQILKIVNSPMFSTTSGKVNSLQLAITRLGFREVKNVVLSLTVLNMFNSVKGKLFDRNAFWEHSLTTSLAGVTLGNYLDNPRVYLRDELHLAGLVHDIGKIILDAYFSDDFEMALGLALRENIPLFEAEKIVLGVTHADVGAFLAKEWNLPDTAIGAIEFHHNPLDADESVRHVVHVVNIADYLVNSMEFGVSGNFSRPVFCKESLEMLDISTTKLQELLEQITEDAQKMESFF